MATDELEMEGTLPIVEKTSEEEENEYTADRNSLTEQSKINNYNNPVENINYENEEVIDYQNQILKYLRNQEQYIPEEELSIQEFNIESPEVIEDIVEQVLRDLLRDVNNISSFKEAYSEKKMQNNQFELFDLTKLISTFHINEEVMEKLAFREILVISKVEKKDKIEHVGGLWLDVQTALGSKWDEPEKLPDFTKALMDACEDIKKKLVLDTEDGPKKELEEYVHFLEEEMKNQHKKFLIHVSSQFNVDGRNAGSRVTSWVDKNLHTLEEKRAEYLSSTDNETDLDQKQLYIYIGKKHYDIRVQPEKNICNKYCYSFRRAQGFVGEGANFILMRYLAIMKYVGEFELSCLHIDGGLCRNIYLCEGPTEGVINNEKMDLYKIYRTVVEECGVVQRSCTLLNQDGRIMKHDWENCIYVLQITPISSPNKKKSTSILHFEEAWKHDLQLFSQYMDKKLSSTYQMKSYLFDHKEIGNLIKDFVQNILQIKPENIIHFTKQYFMSYAPYVLPRTEYFDTDVNGCFYQDDMKNGT